jgi:D-lactate dehydrogenase (cytochrome)
VGAAEAWHTLHTRFGSRFSRNSYVREEHCQTLTWLPRQPPDAVVFATDTAEVAEIVRTCAVHRVPLIPFGAGTSLEGQVNAARGGLCLDLSRMAEIIEVRPDDAIAIVQPGVTRKQLNRHLRDLGLFFPVDPGSDATLGGMASTRASGTTTVRYGTMRENVLALQVVLPDGSVVRSGPLSSKSSVGYDLTHLFVGAEGSLGVITELALRLHPQPDQILGGTCPFPSVTAAVQAVIAAIRLGLDLARVELLDELSIRACNAYSNLDLPEKVFLFFELHGGNDHITAQAKQFGEVVDELAGGPFEWTTVAEQRQRLWAARHDAWWAIHAMFPGRVGIPTDACVPISRLPECIAETQRDIADAGLHAPVIGHVGDGNFHLLVMVDPDDGAELRAARRVVRRLSERAIGLQGACTGEHGIGQGKAGLMRLQHGPALDLMRNIKRTLDPYNILNPDKLGFGHDTEVNEDDADEGDHRRPAMHLHSR